MKKILNKNLVVCILIGIAFFFLSMLITAQVKTVNNTEAIAQGKRESELIDDLANLQNEYTQLKEKYESNEKIVDEYKNSAASNDELIASMKKEIEELSIYAGNKTVKGEGITIVMNDGDVISSSSPRTDTLVHDSDLMSIVNELKAAGAEAISINGQRVIATTAIRCVGSVIQINYQKVAPPFTINAIGNAQYLESAINIKNGVADQLRTIGLSITVTRQSVVTVSKLDSTLTSKYASIVEEE